jgi:hypothetical protein
MEDPALKEISYGNNIKLVSTLWILGAPTKELASLLVFF